MKNTLLIFLSASLLLLGACPNPGSPGPGTSPDPDPDPGKNLPAKYAKEFLGEWIRMDTGERWYISGNAIKVNGTIANKTVKLTKTADEVITVKESGRPDYFLFASRVADASFNARVVFINGDENANSNRISRDLIGGDGQKPPIKVTNPQQPEQPPVIVQPDPDTGEITVPRQIPGDPIEILIDSLDWGDIKVGVTPWDDQDMGIIPIARGENLKASIRMADNGVDISALYADGTPQNYIIEIENIGKVNCVGANYEISWDENDFNLFSGIMKGQLDTIVPGTKKQINLTLGSKPIDNEYKNKKIKVTIVNYNVETETTARWEDTVSINYYKEAFSFRFRSERPVQGVIRTPRGKTYYFKTSGPGGNCSHSVQLPQFSEDYYIAFLGASVQTQTETKYSLAIEYEPSSNWESLWGEDMFRYEAVNKSVNTAPSIDLTGENSFMYYLYTGAVQYYRINLSIGVTLSNSALSLFAGQYGTLIATVHPRTVVNKAVTWHSDNLAVATVDGSGNVSAITPGTAKIIATTVDGDKTAECIITVMDHYFPGMEFYVPGLGLAAKLAWLQTNAVSDVNYIVEISADEQISPTSLSYSGKNNIGITLVSTGAERIIDLSSNGSMFTVSNGVTLILGNNVILRGRRSNSTSLVLVKSDGTLVMNSGSRIILNSIQASYSNYGGGVYVENNGSFTMNGGTIFDNSAPHGGGVYVRGGGFTMNGGTISGNTAVIYGNGGGVHIHEGTFTMNGGTIFDNSGYNGGGVYVSGGYENNGTFTMYGGTISGNTASSTIRGDGGSGVYVNDDGSFTMYGGEISDNTSHLSNGGGVSLGGGTFIMVGGKISGNSTSKGGGVHMYRGSFTMSGGEISSNSASSGGGVYVDIGTFLMQGGTIFGNRSTANSGGGGGVYVYNNGSFRISGGIIYGSGENTNIRNTTYNNSMGAALFMSSFGTAEYGTLSGSLWNGKGTLSSTNSTIRVINGVLQQ